VGALHDPAAGAGVGIASLLLALLAARADVGDEAEPLDQLPSRRGVVALVETEVLRRLAGRLGSLDRDRGDGLLYELLVVQVGAGGRDPERDARRVAEDRLLRPLFALSVGFGPVSSPPSGALPCAPSSASHSQLMPFNSS
jgi:hypothetical protein